MRDTKITLFREVKHRVRYYSLHLCMTLFGEYLLIKENGSVKNRRPTRVVTKYFNTLSEAMNIFETILEQKYKKGYYLKTNNMQERLW